MKFDELKASAEKVLEPPPRSPICYGELVDDSNEAFEALGDPRGLIILTDDDVIFRRCPQCSFLSISNHCAKCKNHPKMVAVDFARVGAQMENVGRVCCNFATGTCIERVGEKKKWCDDCLKFWDLEFSHRNTYQLPSGTHEALRTVGPKTRQEQAAEAEQSAIEASENGDEEEWEDELEEAQDHLDRCCSMLINVKYLMEFLADPKLKRVIEPQDRREMREKISEIAELVSECGFDPEPYKEDADEVFNQQDKELLERLQQERDSQSLSRMVDRIVKFD